MNQPGAIYDSSRHDAPASPGQLSRASIRQLARNWLDAGLELLFPPRCAGCQHVDTFWCACCQTLLDELPFPPQETLATNRFTALAASGAHDGLLRQALLALKYEHAPQLAEPLGARLAERFLRLKWEAELVVPVPLHASRERERGYNQSRLVGAVLAQRLGIPLQPAALRRVVATRAQVGLDLQKRRQNVQHAFVAESPLVSGRDVLLVDDVYTSGATLGACAQALQDAGVRTVYGLTLTRAGSPDEHMGGMKRWM